MRNAIKERYRILPYIYSSFYESTTTGAPVMRPLWFEFPENALSVRYDD